MRILFTYLLLLSWSFAFAQSENSRCPMQDGQIMTPSQNCERLRCLFEHKEYVTALKVLNAFKGEIPCVSEDQLLEISQILVANNKFDEALSFVDAKTKEGLSPEVAAGESDRIVKLKILAEKESGAYMRNRVDINTSYNDLIAFDLLDSLYQLDDKSFTISYFPHIETVSGKFHFPSEGTESQFSAETQLNYDNYSNLGTGTVYNDSLIFLSAVPNKAFSISGDPGQFEIICLDINSKKRIKEYSFSVKNGSALHPAFSDSILIFSSDMPGGFGEMDLYKAKISKKGFSDIQNLGSGVNSVANEVYSTIIGDTLYFASDRIDGGFGGLDIYKVALSGGVPMNVGVPINTAYDDFGPLSDGETIKYMISNRPGGVGGSDIYALQWAPTRLFFKELKGKFNAYGSDLSAIIIEIKSTDGTISQITTLDKDGFFALPHVKGMETYDISILEGEMPQGSKLSLFGDEGNVIKEVTMNKDGGFRFELLSPQDYFLEHMSNTDESVLSVDILGMLNSDSETQEGFKIYLQDSEGEAIGMAVTDANGNFAFKSVKPDANYVIRSQITDPNATIHILDSEGKTITTIKPTDGNEFAYVRLSGSDRVITLTNEAEKKVKIAENELFNLPVIYFGLNETDVTAESMVSLQKLVILLEKNPEISLEISGYTDSRGSAAYNLKLSQDRIDAVVDFLVANGIPRDHLTGKGYGETRLLNGCKDGVPCTEAQHAVNRRTEIRIFNTTNP